MKINVNQPGKAPKITREVALAALKAGSKCCTRLSVRRERMRMKGVRSHA